MEITGNRKKLLASLLVAAFGVVLAFGLAGCGSSASSSAASSSASSESSSEASSEAASSSATSSTASESAGSTTTADLETIRIATVPSPHAEILEDVVAPILEEQGYKLDIKSFSDYTTQNPATTDGDVDANYFQHGPYLESYNTENNGDLVSVAAIHYEPFGLYLGKDKSLADLSEVPDGATVVVPNDPTNEARALLLLEEAGLITLDSSAGINATKLDITDNPKDLDIQEVNAELTPSYLAEADVVGINSNYAVENELNPTTDAIVYESDPNGEVAQTYANLLVVKSGNEDLPAIKALAKALTSDDVRDYINENYDGAVLPIF